MHRTIAILAAATLMVVALPGAQAAGTAGLSGGCDSDDTQNSGTLGTTGDVRGTGPVPSDLFESDRADAGASTDTSTDLADAHDAAQAVGNLAEGALWDGESGDPGNSCDGGDSWVEAHAGPAGACYDGDVSVDDDGSYGNGAGVFSTGDADECNRDDGGDDPDAVTGDDDGTEESGTLSDTDDAIDNNLDGNDS